MSGTFASRVAGFPARIATASSRRPLVAILAWIVLSVASLVTAYETLGFNTDTGDLVSDELPFRRSAELLKAEFPQLGSLLVLVVSGEVPEVVDAATRRLAGALAADPEHFDSVHVPGSDPFFERNGLLFLDLDELGRLAERLAELQPFLVRVASEPTIGRLLDTLVEALEEARPATLASFAEPVARIAATIEAVSAGRAATLSWQRLLEEEPGAGTARRVVLVQARADYEQVLPFGAAMEAARRAAREAGIGEGPAAPRLGITGANAVEHEDLLSVMRGAGLGAAAALALVTLILVVGLRSARVVVAAVITLFAGLALTVGFAAVFVGHLNLISIAFAVLYIGLGIDAAVHFSARFQELSRQGIDRLEALRVTAEDISPALALCAVTTAVGFYAFVPTAYSGVGELGLIGGTGMFVSLAAALTLLPALLRLIAPSPRTVGAGPGAPAPSAPRRRPAARALGPAVLAVTALSAFAAAGVRFDSDPLNLSDPANESVRTFRDLTESAEHPLFTAAALATGETAAERLAGDLEALPEVDFVTTLRDFVPGRQDEKLAIVDEVALTLGLLPTGRAPATTAPGRLREVVARYRSALAARAGPAPPALTRLGATLDVLDERLAGAGDDAAKANIARVDAALFATLPAVLERLETSLDAAATGLAEVPDPIRDRWVSPSGAWRLEIAPSEDLSDPDALARFADAVLSVAPGATDDPIEIQRVGEAIVGSFVQAFLTALLAVAVLLRLELGNARDAFLVLVPLLVGAVLLNAVMSLADIRYNFANLIALPLLLGIGVDNGVHVVKRMRDGALPSAAALLRSSTTRAIVISTLTTVVSFGSLGLSAHPGTASMGWVLSIGMGILVGVTLFVLPPLLARADSGR